MARVGMAGPGPAGGGSRNAKSCKIILAGRPGWMAVKILEHFDAKVICI
jgi:hypothetical protein